jgi:hypothetical protein
MTQEALKLALEALEDNFDIWTAKTKAVTALREALAEQCQCPNCKVTLHASDCAVHSGPAYPAGGCDCGAQPEQEPVLWMMPDGKTADKWALQFYGGQVGKPLYTTPQQRKPLTEWQITEIYTKWESTKGTSWADLIRAIEAAHGIKGEA